MHAVLRFFSWPFDAANGPLVAGAGLWMTLVGFGLTWYALILARKQLRKTATAAVAAQTAAEGVKLRVSHFEAAQELANARNLLDLARENASRPEWGRACSNFEEARRCIIRLRLADGSAEEALVAQMAIVVRQLSAICKKIDVAIEQGDGFPELAAISEQNRKFFDILSAVERSIQERSIS